MNIAWKQRSFVNVQGRCLGDLDGSYPRTARTIYSLFHFWGIRGSGTLPVAQVVCRPLPPQWLWSKRGSRNLAPCSQGKVPKLLLVPLLSLGYTIHTLCGHHSRVMISLEYNHDPLYKPRRSCRVGKWMADDRDFPLRFSQYNEKHVNADRIHRNRSPGSHRHHLAGIQVYEIWPGLILVLKGSFVTYSCFQMWLRRQGYFQASD